jgi:hypothetical protein
VVTTFLKPMFARAMSGAFGICRWPSGLPIALDCSITPRMSVFALLAYATMPSSVGLTLCLCGPLNSALPLPNGLIGELELSEDPLGGEMGTA